MLSCSLTVNEKLGRKHTHGLPYVLNVIITSEPEQYVEKALKLRDHS